MYSPVPVTALARAAAGQLRRGWHAPDVLRDLLRADYEADGVALTDSGTSALVLALRAADTRAGRGGIVAIPAYGCYDIATAAIGAGLRIIVYDVDPGTLGPDFASLEHALRCGARVVLVAPLYGIPVDMDTVSALAAAHGAVVVEDAAQGHGAAWRGRPVGTLASLGILSFGRGKGWTGGGGGALLWRGTHGALLAPAAGSPWRFGPLVRAAAQWSLARPGLYGIPAALPFLALGETIYREPAPPRPMPPAAAALALGTRDAALREARLRRQRAAVMLEALPPTLPVRGPRDGQPGFLRLPVRVTNAPELAHRLRRFGVAPGYPGTIAALRPVQEHLHGPALACPGASELVLRLATLPTHSLVRDHEVTRLCRLVADDRGPQRRVRRVHDL